MQTPNMSTALIPPSGTLLTWLEVVAEEKAAPSGSSAGDGSTPSAGSAYWLLKQKAGDLSLQRFDTEAELREHMDAMWRFTDWHVVAVGIRPNGLISRTREMK